MNSVFKAQDILESWANPTHMTFNKQDAAYVLETFKQMLSMYHDDIRFIIDEVNRARDNWPEFNSAHEGYAVLLEEVDELKAHVWTNQKNRDLDAMYKEAKHVAAMAVRFMGECCSEEKGRK